MTVTPLALHTSDMTAPCLHRVELRLRGMVDNAVTPALYLGSLTHKILELVHRRNAWTRKDAERCAKDAFSLVEQDFTDEGRRMDASLLAKRLELDGDAMEMVFGYVKHFAPWFDGAKLIGIELPIRLDIGMPVVFESHIDLLYEKDGELYLWDWKTTQESPSPAFLRRDLQLGLYWLAIKRGQVYMGDEVVGWWDRLDRWPVVEWIHMRNCLPYKRKTTTKGDDGEEQDFERGDDRPVRTICRDTRFVPENESVIVERLRQRARLAMAGEWPAQPDKRGCDYCDSRQWCAAV